MKPIFLDYNATTPVDPEVMKAMLPFFTETFGNPSNTLNPYGWAAENAVKFATDQVADLIHCKAHELTWNCGATEGNNAVVFGLIRKLRKINLDEKIHFLTSNAEHLSVINSFRAAKQFEKIEVDFIAVNSTGTVDVETLKKYIKPYTKLVSLMWINNEIGTINPIHELATFCQNNEIYFHTDATQALGKVEIDLQKTPIHFLTFSGHKFYGPKGVGCLYIRSSGPHIEIEPFLFGGGHQQGRRSGTLNVPAIVGTGKAANMLKHQWKQEMSRIESLSKKLYQQIQNTLPNVILNGPDLGLRAPNNLSLTFDTPIDVVLSDLQSLAFSQGSACSTTGVSSSHVLKAIGVDLTAAQRTMRLSLGRWTTEDEINLAAETLIKVFKKPQKSVTLQP